MLGIGNYIARKGTAQLSASAGEALSELVALAKDRSLIVAYKVGDETKTDMGPFLEFCGGVVRKTVNGAADLSLVQTQACLALMQALPEIKQKLST